MTEEIQTNQETLPDFELVSSVPELAPKRGRGRPPKTENIDKDNVTAKKPTKRVTNKANNADNLGKQIEGLHIIAASMTGLKELIITAPEAALLANSIIQVCEEYNLSIDGKTGAAMQLLATAAMIYAPRAIALYNRKKDNAE